MMKLILFVFSFQCHQLFADWPSTTCTPQLLKQCLATNNNFS
jgi:hypothetical protein